MIITDKTREGLRIAAFRHLIENGINHEEELRFVVREIFGTNIPSEVAVEGHQSFWEVMVDDFFHKVPNQAVRSTRGGGKTYNVGVAKSVKMIFKPGLRISNFAATENQGQALFSYVGQLLGPSAHPEVAKHVESVYGSQALTKPRPVPERLKPEGSIMKVLVGTLRGVNSAHVDDLVVDERALMEDNVFKESMGMMTPRAPYPGVLTVLSTVKTAGDPMDVLMNNAEQLGFKPYLNNILDVMHCEEKDCSGCKTTIARSDDEKEEKSFYDFCQGRILGRRIGHYSVAAARRKFTQMGLTNAIAQLFCEQPESEEKAFPMFRFEKHVKDLRNFVQGRAFYIMGDFGKRDASVFIKSYLTPDGTIYLDDEMSGGNATIQDWIVRVTARGFNRAAAWLVDVAGRQTTITSKKSAIDYLEEEGWTVVSQKMDEVETTELVRDLLKAGKLIIHPSCLKTIEAFNRATNMSTGQGDNKVFLKIIKHNKFSHFIDAVRYGVKLLMDDAANPVSDTYVAGGR